MAGTKAILVNFKGSNDFHSSEKLKTGSIAEVKDIHQTLIDACIENDAGAQKKLYELYSAALFNTCKRMVQNRDDAQDILQESFIDAFRGMKNFRGESTLGAWIKRIVVNKSIHHLKRKKLIDFESLSLKYENEAEENDDGLEISVLSINEAIQKLPAGCRMVFLLKAMENYDHKEIAEQMKISVGTSKSQYNRAKELLRELLKNV